MKITWTVEHSYSLFINDAAMKNMIDITHDYMQVGYDKESAIICAIGCYIANQNNSIFYNVTNEVISQIEEALNKLLTE